MIFLGMLRFALIVVFLFFGLLLIRLLRRIGD